MVRMDWSWLGNLTKPFSNLLNPITERIGNALGRRKPRLFVHLNPTQSVWCVTGQAGKPRLSDEMAQVMFWAGINHDDDKFTLIIMGAYPEGTKSQIVMAPPIAIPPGKVIETHVDAFVVPIKGQPGQPWETKFILVDQFQRKYKTQKITFRWAGAPEPPASVPAQTNS